MRPVGSLRRRDRWWNAAQSDGLGDFDIGGAIGGDQRPARTASAAPVWSTNGDRVRQVGEQGNSVLASVDVAAGKVDRKTAAQDLMSYTADAKAARFAMVVSTPTVLGDLFVQNAAGGAPPKKLTSFNDRCSAT